MQVEEVLFTELASLIHETSCVLAELRDVDKERGSLTKLFLAFDSFHRECVESSPSVGKKLELL